MKIDSTVKSASTAANAGVKRAPQTGDGASAATGSVDKVEISSGLQEAGAALASAPVADADRVSEIKQAISQGKYQIDPERIADGLLASVQQMLAASS